MLRVGLSDTLAILIKVLAMRGGTEFGKGKYISSQKFLSSINTVVYRTACESWNQATKRDALTFTQ